MSRKITVLAAVLATATTLAVAAGPADAVRSMSYSAEDTTFTFRPTGGAVERTEAPAKYISGTDDDYCQKQTKAANSWIDAAVAAWYNDDTAAQEQAQRYADAIAGEANAKGCTIYD